MRKKMLISLALVVIMMFNCIAPLMQVQANTATTFKQITLNSALYNAVKSALTKQNVDFKYNDNTLTLGIASDVIATITEMNLNEGQISDLTGLENFSNLTRVELSGNDLSEESNLNVLSNLKLNYLDLSTNHISDVSTIAELISNIEGNNGTVILTSQTVTDAFIFENNGDETVKVKLPLILEKAGYIKAAWMKQSADGPFITEIPHSVTADNREITVNIEENGILKFEIKIVDSATEAGAAANKNPAAKNALKDSVFTTYVVVHGEKETGMYIPDANLYNEIKKQLSAGQELNAELASYPYKVDVNNEIIYEECTYTTSGSLIRLTVVGENTAKYYTYANSPYIYSEETGRIYTDKFEKTTIKTVDSQGNISYKEGYKVAIAGENRNLYNKAYDEAQIFVISNKDLMNKITSLILNNKQIRDLTGIENFVGLKSDLNVSHNYLSDIDSIYTLQENKDAYEKELQAAYNALLKGDKNSLSNSLEETVSAKEDADENIEKIAAAIKQILTKIEEAAKIQKYTIKKVTIKNDDGTTKTEEQQVENEKYAEQVEAKVKEIKKILDQINGYIETDTVTGKTKEVKGYVELLDEALESTGNNLQAVYARLTDLYDTYNNEYKLLTLLSDEMNYLTLEEYVAYKENIKVKENKVTVAKDEISHVSDLAKENMLTELEKALISSASNGAIDFENEESFDGYFEDKEEPVEWIDSFREIAIYSEMANYCLIKRMEEDTASNYCYAEEYLLNRIKDLSIEGIDTSIEEKILGYIKQGSGDNMYSIYANYKNTRIEYSNGRQVKVHNTCEGEYNKVTSLGKNATYYDADEIIALVEEKVELDDDKKATIQAVLNSADIVKTLSISEIIDEEYKGAANNLYLYNEAVVLSNRLINSNVERYVTLPDLKKLDISYNSYLKGIERLRELPFLRELQANANYITNIDQVNWEALKYLRKLGLSYNYITDIKPLEVLTNIVNLDVSHNLISGAFNFNFTNSQKTLQNFNLSHNQIEDITSILEFLDRKSNGNFVNYLAREDTMNIDLGYQTIVVNVEKPILLETNPQTIDIDLPMIFVQLLAIDAERTSLGNTSLDGRIESEGRYVTVNTRTEGSKTGEVEIVAMPGVETCVGIGTKATINYVVGNKAVEKLTINENIESLEKGKTATFTAIVEGKFLEDEDKAVTWSVEGAQNEETTIDEKGVLTVSAEETAETIKVVATSNYDAAKKAEKEIKLFAKAVTAVKINEEVANIEKGATVNFTATVEGEYLEDEDKTVTWSIKEAIAEGTAIDEKGVLTVSAAETLEKLTIVATSNFNNEIYAEKEITLFVRTVSEVKVVPETTTVKPGTTVEFTAEVVGENLQDADKGVTWSVYGNTTPYTMINQATGELTIAENENAEALVVSATSKFDESKFGTAEVKLVIVRSLNIESKGNQLNNGDSMTLTATVEGSNLTDADKVVVWEVTGANDTKTVISTAGVLTIGADETAEKVVVKATSVTNPSVSATKEIEIVIPVPELGYDLAENDETVIVGVSPSTTAAEFKSKLVKEDGYTVVVKRNGEEISDTTNVATGDMAVVYFGDALVEVFEIVVKGDVNGDGLADALDSSLIKAHRARLTTLTGLFYDAADIDNNNEISVKDVRLLLYHRARIDGYIL